MKKLEVDLTNCHGIHRLEATISFEGGRAAAIYAPNGMMKTSFARTFGDLSRGVESTDHLFPDRSSSRVLTDEKGTPLNPDQVVVIVSYDEEMGPTEETSTLLVDKGLRDEYERLQKSINEARAKLVTALKAQAKTRRKVDSLLSLAFTRDETSFFTALQRVETEIADELAPYADLPYDIVFDDKVVALLKTDEFRAALADYITRFNDLLDGSTYFSRETFNYYNAETIAKTLGANGFFDANHTLSLNSADGTEQVSTHDELTSLIQAEKDRIADDEKLRKTFSVIETKLNRNQEGRNFLAYVAANEAILPELDNVARFNERVWKSYLKVNEELYSAALTEFQEAAKSKKEIQAAAAEQRGQWEDVIEIFNARFFVPFTLTAANRTNVVLGLEPVAKLGFEFEDGPDRVDVERSELLEILSTGEKKALYILNVLFEVERRKNTPGETLFIVDDIADSFDYKNKYAIIQYLKDIAEEKNFRLVVLTHNFDFYRTLESRFVPYSQCLMSQKTDAGMALIRAAGIKNPFINDFKPNFFTDAGKRIAAIPFVRNLLEYTRGDDDPGYIKLTSLLHWKSDTASITQGELDTIFNGLFATSGAWSDPTAPVIEMINAQADLCAGNGAILDLANKITLSIAIRIAAEKFMVEKIDNQQFVDDLKASQTGWLFTRFKKDFSDQAAAIRTIDGVVLMTPEHIHVNSFMYEPILDMSDEHLSRLLGEVRALR